MNIKDFVEKVFPDYIPVKEPLELKAKSYATVGNIEIPLIENVHSDLRDEGYKKGIRTASLFNREFILKQKYQSVMLGGYRGMFDKKVKKILPDQEQYPYESFYLNNIDKL